MACQVNTQLLPVKLFYFFYYGGISCLVPYLPHYLKQEKGFTPVDVTTILGSVPFLVIFTKPISGHIADKTQSYRATLLVTLFVGTVSMCLVSTVPKVSGYYNLNSSCDSPECTNDTTLVINRNNGNHFHNFPFWIAASLLTVANALGLSVAYTIMDALTLIILKDRTKDYGKQRMWMSVGLATALLTVSVIMDLLKTGHDDYVNYAPAFVGFVICIASSSLCVLAVPYPSRAPAVSHHQRTLLTSKKSSGLSAVLPHLKQGKFLSFLFMAFVCGMNFGMSAWMAPFYLKVNLGASQTGISCAVIFVCSSTMGAFFVSGHVIGKLGHEITLSLCLMAYGCRALLWSFLTNPWLSLPVEILFGLCMGLWLPTMGSYACKMATNGNKASAQSVLSAAYDGFGVGVGNLISGWLYQHKSGQLTWRIFAAFTGLCGISYFTASVILLRWATRSLSFRNPKPSRDNNYCSRRPNLNELVKETSMV